MYFDFLNLDLTFEQRKYVTSNSTINGNVKNYLIQNNFSDESKEFVEQMIDLAALNKATFTFDSNLNTSNSLSFNSVTEFQNYLNSRQLGGSELASTTNQNQKTASVKNWVAFPSGGVKTFITQNMTPLYSIENVNSNAFGFTLAFSWNQTSYDKSISGNTATINLYGALNYNLFFEGVGTIFTENIRICIKVNTLTGEIISSTVIP